MSSASQNRAAGLAYALAGFALLSCGDAIIKSMAGQWPGTAIAALRFSFGAIGLAVFLLMREGREGLAIRRPLLHLARGTLLAAGSLCFFLAVFVMPLAEATTITFINPVFAALFSMLLLGERAPRAIWVAMALGFAGVVLVLRPNLSEIGPLAILPLGSAAALAALMVLNRMAANTGSVLAMQFTVALPTALLLLPATLVGHFSGDPAFKVTIPDWTVVARCAIVAVTATCAHALIYLATTKASAGAVAPMTYGQLIVAMTIGALAYGEYPDAAAVGGAALVIAGGLYLWWRSAISLPSSTDGP